jgi:hypothetical protein
MVYSMPSFWRECQMSTLCTAFPSFFKEGESPLNTLKNCAKTTAKINVQEIILRDELRPSWRSHLEFYTFRSRPPLGHANIQNTMVYMRYTTVTRDAQTRQLFASHRVV